MMPSSSETHEDQLGVSVAKAEPLLEQCKHLLNIVSHVVVNVFQASHRFLTDNFPISIKNCDLGMSIVLLV